MDIAVTKRLKKQLELNKELSADNIEQRKLIERITRLVKDWKDILPPKFNEKIGPYINQYERRFTVIGDKLRPNHPVFRESNNG